MREIDAEITELLNPGDLDCDVACLVFDTTNADSFRFCATTYNVSRRCRLMLGDHCRYAITSDFRNIFEAAISLS